MDVDQLHLAVCRRFGNAVAAVEGRWELRTPCDAWDARAVLEHVIGFHDVLLLRPLDLKARRPQDDPRARWELTYDQLVKAFDAGLLERIVDAPRLVPLLTRDVLVHTWDVARAVGADDRLDPRWCEQFYTDLPSDPAALTASGMFNPPVVVSDAADMQSRLLARLGRNPSWQPPTNYEGA